MSALGVMACVQRGVAQVGNNVKNSAASGSVGGARYPAHYKGHDGCVACETHRVGKFPQAFDLREVFKKREVRGLFGAFL